MLRYIFLVFILLSCSTSPKEPSTDDGWDDIGGATNDSPSSDTADGDGPSDDDEEETGDPSDSGDTNEEQPVLPALQAAGPGDVNTSTGSFDTTDGCTLDYTRYQASDPIGEAFIFHGFMRGQNQFSDLANHLASWGVSSTTVGLCHSTFTDVDTEQNSRDAIELARNMGIESVVWMGQSNGGMSALIAGGIAPDITVGILGLDPVESMAGGGESWADEVRSPAAALFGIADSCNEDNSGRSAFGQTPESIALRVTEADHCSFEFPTGPLCILACQRAKSTFSESDIDRTILELSTAWTLARVDATFDDTPWWNISGERYSALIEAGAITPL